MLTEILWCLMTFTLYCVKTIWCLHYCNTLIKSIYSRTGWKDYVKGTEVARGSRIAWRKFLSLKHILKIEVPLSLKTKVIDIYILLSFLYGAQTRTLSREDRRELVTCQRSIERNIPGITKRDRWRSIVIREKTNLQDAQLSARGQKWSWTEHVARMEEHT